MLYTPSATRITDTVRRGMGVTSHATLHTVIDGKIARITVSPNEEQALETAGLRE